MTNKTLLDEFAMAALTGLIVNESSYQEASSYGQEREKALANKAYRVAEAMMEEHTRRMEVQNDVS